VSVEQQRQRHGRLRRDELLRVVRGSRHAARPLRASARSARARRLARRQEGRAGLRGNLPDGRADVRRAARRRDPPDRRPHGLPGLDTGADRRRAGALMRDLKSSLIAVVVLTLVFGLAIPVLFTGFAQLAFSSQANGGLIKQNGQVVGSRLAAQGFAKPQYFHERPSATSPAYGPGGTTFAKLGPTKPRLAQNLPAAPRGL